MHSYFVHTLTNCLLACLLFMLAVALEKTLLLRGIQQISFHGAKRWTVMHHIPKTITTSCIADEFSCFILVKDASGHFSVHAAKHVVKCVLG